MDRRNFLFGNLAAVAGGLIIKPTEGALTIFKPTLGETLAVTRGTTLPTLMAGTYLYDERGNPVAVVRSTTHGRIGDRLDIELLKNDVFAEVFPVGRRK